MSTHFPTDLSDNIQSQNSQQKQIKQPLVSFNIHPGFLCFFKDLVDKKDWTFYQCYQNVAKSSHQLMKIKNPIQTILNNSKKSNEEIQKQLQLRSQKDSSFAYFNFNKQKNISQKDFLIIQKQKNYIKNIQLLKHKLNDLEKIKIKIIDSKKKEFIIKQKQKEEQFKKIMQEQLKEKERRANKVRQIQQQVQAQNKNK